MESDCSPAPQHVEDHLADADAAFASGDLPGARRHLRQALELAPETAEILAALGALNFQLQNYEEALAFLLKANRLRPDQPTILVQLATAALQLDRVDLFETALGGALALDARHPEALRLLARAHLATGDHLNAARTYHRLLQAKPQDLHALLALAHCFRALEDLPTALAAGEEAARLAPHDSRVQDFLRRLAA
jgi:cytochrome c-type biogenesis protein CcmH/NrfG